MTCSNPLLTAARASGCCVLFVALFAAAGCGDTILSASAPSTDASQVADLAAGELGADAPADAPIGPDVPAPADATADADAQSCGAAGCGCTENAQCDSAICIETAAGQQCAKVCLDSCAGDMKCVSVTAAGGDVVNVCVPARPRLCEPCGADSDCSNVLGGGDSRCVPYVDAVGSTTGSFCGNTCSDASPCATGYSCKATTSVGGVKGNQCVKDDLACPCDLRATKLALATLCTQASAVGTCTGKRSCGPGGLSGCDAPSALAEQCNAKDDDCDGQTDEPSTGMCDDGQACSYDSCVGSECQHPAKPGACDDGSVCTSGDECDNGKCASGAAVACDDKNPCTLDSCDAAKGCTATADDQGSCTDGSVCTVTDVCAGGVCLPGAATACDDSNPCTTDSCDAKTGCVFAANDLPCTDGDLCTLGDVCAAGVCGTTGKLPCNDGNPCTDDTCSALGGCKFTNNTAACDDNNGCTTGDACTGGICVPSAPASCDDGNPCTTETCDFKGGCKSADNVAACSDGDVCTTNDVCGGGKCAAGKLLACSDGNPCTDDSCDGKLGCVFLANAATCTDNNACTEGDACKSAACEPGAAKNCDDANGCTLDTCDPKKACVSVNNTAVCSDDSACTEGDGCVEGACAPGKDKNCDDGNPCTADACDKAKGCLHANTTEACSDGNVCSVADACAGGKCVPGKAQVCNDGNPCTDDACDPVQGCVAAANSAACTDANACTGNDTCANGKCVGGVAPNCNDGNACTDDGCAPADGCHHVANGAGCSDGNVCTVSDTCKGSVCLPGSAKVCNDGNACTADACDAIAGCVTADTTAPCDDGSVCSEGDVCAAGQCVPGKTMTCDDGNPCTADTCDAKAGCQQPKAANDTVCGNGTCQAGVCTCAAGYAGGGGVCTDVNECATSNPCNVNAGCVNTAGSYICTCKTGFTGDGKSCTDVNECLDGSAGCDSQAACANSPGSFKCTCNLGYAGDGKTCATVCTDGVKAGAEECDDGNKNDADACTNSCKIACTGKCSNGSCSDCNVDGTTLVPSSAFVDAAPPSGWVQCAGWVNTSADDVGPKAPDNCIGTTKLRLRVWDASNTLVVDVYETGLTSSSAWPSGANYLDGCNCGAALVTAVCNSTYWPCTNNAGFYGSTQGTGGGGCGGFAVGGMNFSNGNGGQLTVSPAETAGKEIGMGSCYGSQQYVGFKTALYK